MREHQGDLELGTTAVWQHGYDELNQRISTRRPDGHQSQWLTYGSGHVHGLLLDGQDIVGFERDALHREIGREQANGLLQQQRYDPAGRLLEQSISPKITPPGAGSAGSARSAGAGSYKNNSDRAGASTTSTTLQRRYQYDPAGQLIGIGDSRRGNLSYRYDPVGRLLQAHSRLGREHFAFDPAGNILDGADNPEQHTRHLRHAPGVHGSHAVDTADAAHQPPGAQPLQRPRVLDNLIKQYAGTHYQWDARGNLTERLHQGQKTTFAWDGYNRLIASTDARGQTTRYRYDPLGRRIAKSGEHSLTTFGWDGDTLAFESTQHAFNSDPHRAQGQQDEQGLGTSVHYIHEPGSFVPLVQIRQARAVQLQATPDIKALIQANGGRYDIEQDPLWSGKSEPKPDPFAREEIAYYQCDHLGTPQELTDHAGQVAWSAHYKAWGEAKQAISEAGRKAGLSNPIRFQGQYWDEETGLHYNRYRYYDPQAGRFVSKDPIGLLGGFNTQEYAPNSIEWVDPLGLASKKPRKNSNASTPCATCDPCAGKNPAREARGWQGPKNAPYVGVDSYANAVLKKGAVIYSLYPGGTPGYAVPIGTLNKYRQNPHGYHEGLQVEKDSAKGPMRTQVRAYRVTENICVAKGRAKANTTFGDGGAVQYYIPQSEKGKLSSGRIISI